MSLHICCPLEQLDLVFVYPSESEKVSLAANPPKKALQRLVDVEPVVASRKVDQRVGEKVVVRRVWR